jgi:hypothetical protein
MKVRRAPLFAIILVLLAGSPKAAPAQAPVQPIGPLVHRLHSDVATERADAARRIMASPELLRAPEAIPQLVILLERENRVIADAYRRGTGVSRELGEDYGEYY